MSASAIAAKLKLKRQAPEQQAPSSSKASRTEAPAAAPAPVTFAEGEAVLGNFKGMGDWDEAVVVGVKPGGLYVLDYTDEGLIEEDVPASRIMRQGGAGAADVAEALAAAPAPPAAAGASSNDGRADAAGGSAAGRGGAGGGAGGAKPASSESESEEEEEESPEFLKSSVWRGHRPGYVFKRGVLSGGEAAQRLDAEYVFMYPNQRSRGRVVLSVVLMRCSEYAAQHRIHALMSACSARRLRWATSRTCRSSRSTRRRRRRGGSSSSRGELVVNSWFII